MREFVEVVRVVWVRWTGREVSGGAWTWYWDDLKR